MAAKTDRFVEEVHGDAADEVEDGDRNDPGLSRHSSLPT